MKKLFFLFITLFIIKFSFAGVLTVSNYPGQPAQYTNFAAALAAAQNGDSIYLLASPNTYGAITINKPLSVFGAGINSRRPAGPNRSLVTTITISSNNVLIDGIRSTSSATLSFASGSLYNITFRNSVLDGSILHSSAVCNQTILQNLLIENCILAGTFGEFTCLNSANNIIRNSILDNFTGRAFLLENCQVGIHTVSSYFSSIRGANNIYKNCIFLRTTINMGDGSITNSQFLNCLTFGISPNANASLANATYANTASGTIINTDPLFANGWPVAVQSVQTGEIYSRWNPTLSVSSPALNAGTDGLNIGVYGGPLSYDFSFEPNGIPVIRSFSLQNSVIPPNGSLQIKSTATKAIQ